MLKADLVDAMVCVDQIRDFLERSGGGRKRSIGEVRQDY